MSSTDVQDNNPVELAAKIAAAYVSNNHLQASELPDLIRTLHAALAGLADGAAGGSESAPDKPTPAQIRKSITHDGLISFEDGRSYKTLKRHLTLRGLAPEDYRAKWGLPRDYPMTAAGYSEARSALAKSSGLGRVGSRAEPAPAAEAEALDKPRGRKAKQPAAE